MGSFQPRRAGARLIHSMSPSSSALPDPSSAAASPSGRVKGREAGAALPLTRPAGMRQPSFLLPLFSLCPVLHPCLEFGVPVLLVRPETFKAAASLAGDRFEANRVSVALRVVVRGGDQQ